MSAPSLLSQDLSIPISEATKIIETSNRLYRQFSIRKKSNSSELRILTTPSREARLIQTWLCEKIFKLMPISKSCFGYVKKKSIYLNATYHSNNSYFIKRDIKDFFPNIQFEDLKVRLAEDREKISLYNAHKEDIEDLIESFCFGRNHELLQGFISSPIISNIVMRDFDQKILLRLKELSDKKIKYSRYADDIIISFNKFDHREKIELILNEEVKNSKNPSLKINRKKSKFGIKSSGSAFVNGLKICHDNRITLHRKYKDKVRAIFYQFDPNNPNPKLVNSIIGHLNYIKSVDSHFYNKIIIKYDPIIEYILEIKNK